MTSKWPRLTVNLRPDIRATVDALGIITRKSNWEIIEAALSMYVAAMPDQDQQLVAAMAARSVQGPAAPAETRSRKKAS